MLFKFEHPQLLWALLAAPAALLLAAGYRWWRRQALEQLGTVDRVLAPQPARLFWLKTSLLAAALALLAVVLANPQRGAKKQTATQQSADVFIALDISQSMLAEDMKPSRLDLAKRFAQKLVQSLEGERVGLIFFAGNAYVQVPLSTDYTFLLQSLQSADPSLMTEQGTAIPAAIELAEKSFEAQPGGGRALVLITDGENHDEDAVSRASTAFGDGVVVYAVGVGTAEGAPIPTVGLASGQYKRDEQGEVVRTRFDEAALRQVALAGGGRAYHIAQGDAVLSSLQREVSHLQKRDIAIRSFAEQESWFQWFLLPALLLLGLRFWVSSNIENPNVGRVSNPSDVKKNPNGGRVQNPSSVKIVIFFLLASGGTPISAQSAHRSLLSGDRDYDQERYQEAEKHYRNATEKNPGSTDAAYNYGNALYQQGKYPEAAQQFERAAAAGDNPGVLYNLGNALLKQGKYSDAAKAYERSLRLRPGDANTKMNLQMAKKKIKEEEQKQQQQQQNQQQQPNQGQNQSPNQQNQPPQNQPQNQPPKPQEQQPNQGQGQPQQPNQNQPQDQPQQSTGKMSQDQARRMLETTIGPNDQKSARKYRQRQSPTQGGKGKKDW